MRASAFPAPEDGLLGFFDDRHAPGAPLPPGGTDRHPHESLGGALLPGETVLHNRAALGRSQQLAMAAAFALPLLLLAGAVLAMLAGFARGQELVEKIVSDPIQLSFLAFAAAIAVVQWIQVSRERLIVGPAGLRYASGLPVWLAPLSRSWSLAADRIRDASVVRPAGLAAPVLVRIELETAGGGRRRVQPFKWVDPAHHHAADFELLEKLRTDPGAVARLFDDLPLVGWVRARGFALSLPPLGTEAEGNPFTRAQEPRIALALFFVGAAFVYSLVDMALISETYAAGAPMALLLAGGLGGGGLAWWLLAAGGGERAMQGVARCGVAALVGGAAMAALYPGLVRINRIGAPDPQPHLYRHGPEGRLAPATADAPPIDLPDLVGMLPGSEPGDLHELWIRRGSLGFDQIDIAALDAWIERLAQAEAPRSNP